MKTLVKAAATLALVGAGLGAAPAQAATATFHFDQVWSSSTIPPGPVPSVATLTIEDVGGGLSQFTLLGTFATLAGYDQDSAYVDYVRFNGPDGIAAAVAGNAIDGFEHSDKTDASLPFTWKVNFPNGRRDDRFLSADTATWTIAGASGEFVRPMLVHINSLSGEVGTFSIKVISAVPEPAQWMLFAAGLGLLGAMGRRSSRRS